MNDPLGHVHPAVEPAEVVRSRARSRLRLLGFVLLTSLGAIGGRGAQLCLAPHDLTVERSSEQRWGKVTLRAPRGDILDRHGRRLATTVDAPSIVVDPMLVRPDEVRDLSARLARVLDLDASFVADRLRRDGRFAVLASNVHPAGVDQIRRIDHPALWVQRNPRRYYPEGQLASQVIGFVDASGAGRQGLESSLDEYLRGGVTVVQRRRDRFGRAVDGPLEDHWGDRGMDVHTTLDRTIQRVAERAIEGALLAHEPKAAYATVIDVRTGDILAMANAPTFNPNALDDDASLRRNHAVLDAIEPGSVFKPFSIAAALEEGQTSEDALIDCEGGRWNIGRTRIRDDHAHGIVTTTEVMKYSSNIGTAKLALGMGPDAFLGYLQRFGFGARTGITLPGERRGVVRAADRIRPIELATTAYGQGVTVTQVQLAMAIGAIANEGRLMRPRLVARVVDSDGTPAWQQRSDVLRRVVSKKTAAAVTRMMVAVTEEGGTGTRARVPGYLVAAKTGTAEKVVDGRYTDARIGSLIGFVPADKPVIAIVVTVDEPTKGSRYGGVVAGPVFAEIAERSLRYLGVPADPGLLEQPADPLADSEPVEREALALHFDEGGWTVPDLSGRPMREVLVALQDSGVTIQIEGSGRAVAQRPAPGQDVAAGDTISVVFR